MGNKVKLGKRIALAFTYGAFKIGRSAAQKELQKIDNEDLKSGTLKVLDIADDSVKILTDNDPANREQFHTYIQENHGKLTDTGLQLLRGVIAEKLDGDAQQAAFDLLGVLALAIEDNTEVQA